MSARAQLSFTDQDGYRFQAILTDHPTRTSPFWSAKLLFRELALNDNMPA